MKLEKILVPVDFSESSQQALKYAAFLAARFEARLEALFVWEPPVFFGADAVLGAGGLDPTALAEFGRESGEEELHALVSKVCGPRATVQVSVVVGPVAASIVDASRGADLIVMGTHGRGALGHLVLGSVAARVSAKVACPVVTVKADPKRS